MTEWKLLLSLECVWFLAPLFGPDEVFPSLPNVYQINNLEIVTDDLNHQNQLAPYIHNQDASYQITTALNECRGYGDDDSRVLVFLFNLLRNYVEIVKRPPGLRKGKTTEKSCTFYSVGSTVYSLLLVPKNLICVIRTFLESIKILKNLIKCILANL